MINIQEQVICTTNYLLSQTYLNGEKTDEFRTTDTAASAGSPASITNIKHLIRGPDGLVEKIEGGGRRETKSHYTVLQWYA